MRLMASGRSYRRVIYPLTLCLASITLTGARAQDRPAQPGFRTATELIRVDFTVTDKAGRPVSGLTAKDFSVKEDGKEQAIVGFDAFANNDGAIASAAARGGASDTSTAKAAARQTLEVSQSNFSRSIGERDRGVFPIQEAALAAIRLQVHMLKERFAAIEDSLRRQAEPEGSRPVPPVRRFSTQGEPRKLTLAEYLEMLMKLMR